MCKRILKTNLESIRENRVWQEKEKGENGKIHNDDIYSIRLIIKRFGC